MQIEDLVPFILNAQSELSIISGGSRIFPGVCANSQKCYYFSIFCRKLHENERIWTPPPLGSSNDDIRMQASRFDTDFLSQMKSPTVSSLNSLLRNGMKRTEQICFLQEWTTHSQMLQTCHKSTAQKI